ncbi:DNRLRE domain-containing protein [Microtetraspora sp. AC03309]|uniref:DNRLRE domain-containing protein n=1 Tax=Microtetraspora sp. AC03309 TaxID=2779376 RepID=UPI001E34677B|nr:DNRLRE domain-containing protein [Microtetraspora sp. AC03309]
MFLAGVGVPDGLAQPAAADTTPAASQESSVEGQPIKVAPPSAKGAEDLHSAPKRPAPVWPKAGSAQMNLTADKKPITAPGLPVTVAAADPSDAADLLKRSVPGAANRKAAKQKDSPTSVRVETFDNTVAKRLGGIGVVLRLTRADGGSDIAPAKVSVDYSSFRGAGGGGFASRLTLIKLPACVLDATVTQECTRRRVLEGRQLPVLNDVKSGKLTAVVGVAPAAGSAATTSSGTAELADGDAVYLLAASAAATASNSSVGDFSATDLKPSGTWQVGPSGGAFTYSYPISAPPPPAGKAPELALQYSSASVDSLTSRTNNQSGLTGMGWELNSGFIERAFVSCKQYELDNRGGGNPYQKGWADRCWQSPYGDADASKLTLSVGGHSSDIVEDQSTGQWRTVEDFGWKIEQISSGGDSGQPWWRITTQDGTVYRFGYHRDSSLQVPFIGDNVGEPCHDKYPTSASQDVVSSLCTATWRWQLDQEVDPKGNVIDYTYEREEDFYCTLALDFESSCDPEYDRAAHLQQVTYGSNENVSSSSATGRIVFATSPRSSGSGAPSDEPVCDGTGSECMYGVGPVFFTSQRLDTITTQTWSTATGGWDDVTRLELSYEWMSDVLGDYSMLWLDSIRRVGLAGGPAIEMPLTTFDAVMPDNSTAGGFPVSFPRISTVNNELGGRSEVTYGQANPCPTPWVSPPTEGWDTLTYDCYFVTTGSYYGEDDKLYFNGDVYRKWLVMQVTDKDLVAGSPDVVTRYDYVGDPAWAVPENPFANPFDWQSRDDYTEFRGYPEVRTIVGSGNDPNGFSITSSTFFRGIDGDQVTDFDGGTFDDFREMNGKAVQEQTWRATATQPTYACAYRQWMAGATYIRNDRVSYNNHNWEVINETGQGAPGTSGSTGWNDLGACPAGIPMPGGLSEVSSTRYEYDATTTGNGPDRDPYRVDRTRQVSREKTTGGWRYTEAKTEYNTDGLPTKVNDYGERGNGSDNTCTAITYARNTSGSAWMIGYKASEEKHAGDDCSAGTLLSRSVTLYDGSTSPGSNTPTRGDVTETRSYSTAGNYSTAKTTFDDYGRPLTTTDPLNKTTTTTYSPAVGWPTGGVTITNPLGHAVTTWSSPYHGQPVGMRDANNNNVNIDYDVLGRTLLLWTPVAPKSGDTPAAKVSYTIPSTLSPVKTTVSRLQSGNGTSAKWVSTHTYIDGLGRAREVQTASPAGGRIVQVTTYDTRGMTAAASGPVHNSSAPGSGLLNPELTELPQWSKPIYDGVGRTTAQIDMSTSSELRRTTTNYLGADKYEVVPPTGGKTVYYTDAADQITKIEEWLAGAGSQSLAARAIAGPLASETSTSSAMNTTAEHKSTADRTREEVPAEQVSDARMQASAEAKRTGKPVAVPELTSAVSSTIANTDGKTLTTTISTRPTKIKRDGAWVPIDTTLTEKGDALAPKAGPTVKVSAGGTGPFATLADDTGNSIALSWPTPLPRPTIERNKARYTDAAGPGADLVVTVLPGGIRHDIELRERPATPPTYRITVTTTGWKLQQDGQGRLTLTDSAGKLVAPLAQPVMYPQPHRSEKAKAKEATAGAEAKVKAKDGHRRRSGHITTHLTRDGDHQVLELTPDAAFLADPTLTFPVIVDPTVNLDTQADTYVADWGPDYSWWDDDRLDVGSGNVDGEISISRGYLQFDTSTLVGKSVTQAQLSLFNWGAPQCGAFGSGIQASRVTSSWDAYDITWNNQPTTTNEDSVVRRDAYEVDLCPDGSGGTITYDVTAMAQDWAAGRPGYGVQLRAVDESGVEDWRIYDSTETTFSDAQPPALTVTYALPSSPTVSNLSITPVTGAAGSSTTPTLHAIVSDPADGGLRADYEIEHDPAYPAEGTGQIWAGSSASVTSGNDAPAAVPAGKLTDGWHIRWRAQATNTGASVSSAWSAWQTTTITVPDLMVDQLQVTPSQVLSGETVTSTLTPALAARVTTFDSAASRVEFELEHDPADTQHGTGQIWTTGTDNVASGTQTTVTVPAGKLGDGWKIRWRARAVKGTANSDWTSWQSVTVDVPDFYTTTYEYDRNGQMTKMTDANGNVRTFTYDLLGRRTQSHDPDAGDSQQAYDAASRLLWSTNGKSEKVSYSYDDLGRKTAVWVGETETGTKLAEWVYDTVAKGQLTSATRYVGDKAYTDAVTSYDSMGRPRTSTLTIPSSEGLLAGTYTFTTSYTTSGAVATYEMPAAGGLPSETVTSTYTDLGLPQALTSNIGGGFTYVANTTYSKIGQMAERSYGADGKIRRNLIWSPTTGWLERITTTTKADTSGPVVSQDDHYTYDISGEITQILDAASAASGSPGQSECFTYDGLHRLAQAWTTTASACGSGATSADNLGIDPYAQTYTYDAVGNLTTLTDGGQASTYTYPASGGKRPNAVTSITRPGGADTYSYDDAGQMVSRSVTGKAGTFDWNQLGQLEKATIDGQDTTMVYDAGGERLIRRDPDGKSTLYLGSMEIEIDGSTITGKRYYTTPDGATVAMRNGGSGVTWLISGLHGTAQLGVNDSSGQVSRERYLPFGQRRGADDLPFTDHGFLGQVEDASTDLTYLSARYYDPAIAKFISTDPLLDLRKPQWSNPYGYAGNNPVGLSDPSGLSPVACEKGPNFTECQQSAAWSDCLKLHTEKWCRNEVARKAKLALQSAVAQSALQREIMEGRVCQGTDAISVMFCAVKNDDGKGKGPRPFDLGEAVGIIATGMLLAGFGPEEIAGAVAMQLGARVAASVITRLGPKFARIAARAKAIFNKCNSFMPGTEVLMADGAHKPIEKIEIGDRVIATDPISGDTVTRPVVALIVGEGDKDLVRIAVDTDGRGDGEIGIVDATDHHPFWVSGQDHWLNASQLYPGARLITPDGKAVEILAISKSSKLSQKVYNLTISDIHTYYVAAGAADVLVHNGEDCSIDPSAVRFSQDSVSAKFKDGRTLEQMAEDLRSGKLDPEDVPEIRLLERGGQLYTLDNRRLLAFQRAGIPVRYRMATAAEIRRDAFKFTTKNSGTSIRVRGE